MHTHQPTWTQTLCRRLGIIPLPSSTAAAAPHQLNAARCTALGKTLVWSVGHSYPATYRGSVPSARVWVTVNAAPIEPKKLEPEGIVKFFSLTLQNNNALGIGAEVTTVLNYSSLCASSGASSGVNSGVSSVSSGVSSGASSVSSGTSSGVSSVSDGASSVSSGVSSERCKQCKQREQRCKHPNCRIPDSDWSTSLQRQLSVSSNASQSVPATSSQSALRASNQHSVSTKGQQPALSQHSGPGTSTQSALRASNQHSVSTQGQQPAVSASNQQ